MQQSWAVGAANQFRAVARSTENETTKALAEGLVHLAEAIRGARRKVSAVARYDHFDLAPLIHGDVMKRKAPGFVSQNIVSPSYLTCTDTDPDLPVLVRTSA